MDENLIESVVTGGAVSNDYFRAGYSATFGLIVALFVNAIILMIMDIAFKAAFGEYSKNAWIVGVFMVSYIFVVGYYASNVADRLNASPGRMFSRD
jgi:hypothetical protein